jgi:hypothetical protein
LRSSHKKLSIVVVVRPLQRRPIKPAGSKYGTIANTTQVTGCDPYLPSLLCVRNVVIYMHHQNDTCVIPFAGGADML